MEVLYQLSYPGTRCATIASVSPRSTLRMALITSSFLIIAIGVFFGLSGAAWGIWVAGAGLVDLLTLPFVIRMIERDQAPESPPAGGADPAATDLSYNPYARED